MKYFLCDILADKLVNKLSILSNEYIKILFHFNGPVYKKNGLAASIKLKY